MGLKTTSGHAAKTSLINLLCSLPTRAKVEPRLGPLRQQLKSHARGRGKERNDYAKRLLMPEAPKLQILAPTSP